MDSVRPNLKEFCRNNFVTCFCVGGVEGTKVELLCYMFPGQAWDGTLGDISKILLLEITIFIIWKV